MDASHSFDPTVSPSTEKGWMDAARRLMDEGQGFLAYDLCREALVRFPDNLHLRLLAALALLRSAAPEEAMALLASLSGRMEPRELQARRLLETLRQRLPELLTAGDAPAEARQVETLTLLSEELVRLGHPHQRTGLEERETLQLLGEIHLELWRWRPDREELRQGRDAFLELFRLSGTLEYGLDSATLSWFLGDRETARDVAAQVLQAGAAQRSRVQGAARFEVEIAATEAHLLLDDPAAALAAAHGAARLPDIPYGQRVAALQRFTLLRERGLPLPEEILALLPPPVLVIFAGQGLDLPGQEEPIFPSYMEKQVKQRLHDMLEGLEAQIGYCSAAAGSEILFIEAMLEREAEVHLFLPCAVEDFVAARVAHAGPRWERRFHNALKLATSITYVTEERLLGHDALFRFNHRIMDGMARLRAELLSTEPNLMLVLDYLAPRETGSPGDVMDHWPDIRRLHVLDLEEVRSAVAVPVAGAAPVMTLPPQPPPSAPERVIRAMLFADIVGFSKLEEEALPGLWSLLAEIKQGLDARCRPPELLESWVDALYVVMSGARELLAYAFELQDAFGGIDLDRHGLGQRPLQLRVGLHAGPVFQGVHPLTGRAIVYGSHVSRAARIEPVTVPGQIYASQQFVAMLRAEEHANLHESRMTGGEYLPWFGCAYLGNQALAKNYGRQPVYHLRRL